MFHLRGKCKAGDKRPKKHNPPCKFVKAPGGCKAGKACVFPHHSPALKVGDASSREPSASAESASSKASDKPKEKAQGNGRKQSPGRQGRRGRSSTPKKSLVIRLARALAVRPISALKGAGQGWTKITKGGKSKPPLKRKLRFVKTADVFSVTIGKDCTLESCQACAREENYKHDPRPPSPKDSEAAARKEAIDLRHELESGEIPTEDLGVHTPTKHTQYRVAPSRPVLSFH